MNERIIQDLIKQATIRANNPLVNSDGKVVCDDWEEGVSLSKFAELIVKEFSKQVQLEGRFRLEREQTLIWLCCENAKKHFGVEK